jgi:hypothetical protein
VYRWPIRLDIAVNGMQRAEALTVEIPARGAAFTLHALLHLGHPIHLALVDAYLKGEVSLPASSTLGSDSQAVVAGLVGPIVALRALRVDTASLRSISAMPRHADAPESSRLRLQVPGRTMWLTCTSTARSATPGWTEIATALPTYDQVQVELAQGAASASLAVAYIESNPEPPRSFDDVASHPRASHVDLYEATAAAWTRLEGLLQRPLDERRLEPIVIRLAGLERSTELEIGWSLVLPRNRSVFAAWLGSDGRLATQLTPGAPPVRSA